MREIPSVLTLSYLSPEIAIRYPVGPIYDIWPLGCLLLDFVAWYLHGWDYVSSFADRRSKDDETPLHPGIGPDSMTMDPFFSVKQNRCSNSQDIQIVATIKRCVVEVRLEAILGPKATRLIRCDLGVRCPPAA